MELKIAQGYRPHAKQLEFHRSNARMVCIAAGVRGGKTKSATVELLRRIFFDIAQGKGKQPAGVGRRRQPRLLYWVVAPTTPLTVHVHRYVNALCPPEIIERVYEDAIWLRGHVLIEFKTAERPDLLVGASVNGILMDEACRCKADAWYGALRGRLADTNGWAIFCSSPLGGKNNWLYREIVAKAGQNGIEAFHWRTIDNTAVPEVIADADHARATMPRQFYLREYEADWEAFGGQIYDEFSDANVISEAQFRLEFGIGSAPIDTKRLFRRVVAGVDWGFSSPGAIVVIGHLGHNQFVVLDESYAANRPITGHGVTWVSEARRLIEKWGVSMFACDPARPDAVYDFRMQGIPCVGAFNDIYLGIRRVSEAIHPVEGRPGLRILDHCQKLIGELRSYQWKSTRDGTGFTELPAEGQSDHACLSGNTWVLTELGYQRISDLARLDRFTVLAVENGYLVPRNAYAFLTKKNASTIALRYDGDQLVCTADHPIWTNSGWKSAGRLTRQDHFVRLRPDYRFRDSSRFSRQKILPQQGLLYRVGKAQTGRRCETETSYLRMGSSQRSGTRWLACASQESQQSGQSLGQSGMSFANRSWTGARRRNSTANRDMASESRGAGVAFAARQRDLVNTADVNEAMRRMRQDIRDKGYAKDRSILPFELQDDGFPKETPWIRTSLSTPEGEGIRNQEVPSVQCRISSDKSCSATGEVLQSQMLQRPVLAQTEDVYNLYVDGPSHAFVANDVVVSNCDALRYSVVELRPYALSKQPYAYGGSNVRPIG